MFKYFIADFYSILHHGSWYYAFQIYMYGIIVLAMLLLSEGISEKVKYATSALSGLTCQLPSCFNGDSIPGNLHPDETPQFVIISFDDAVNDLNKDFYERLFTEGRVNPSGCPIAATFFVSHEWTDYSQVNHLYSQGHEISSHTVTHSHPTGFSEQRWTQEISGFQSLFIMLTLHIHQNTN